MNDHQDGSIFRISGPVVQAYIEANLALAEQVWVGERRLAGEVIAVSQQRATLQVYEQTAGLHVGEPIYGSGQPLSVTLGPGLLGNTFDGIQRPLAVIRAETGIYIVPGVRLPALDVERQWQFKPQVEQGSQVRAGEVVGIVPENALIDHRILVPIDAAGTLEEIVAEGEYQLDQPVAQVRTADGRKRAIKMTQRWPVRRARPVKAHLAPVLPLITGQRIIDTFFPIAKGGKASIPGGFGTGKTVTLHSLAKWSDADMIVYVGCGERGNEMTEVLEDFPTLEDPRTGRPLMERTILIANTSNMPVAAREASIYTGLTIAEYFRDQGYDVALIADSTSRWAQALREISGRLEEMPAEEGYPAYLPSRLAAFYERAGRTTTLAGAEGSVTVIGAVSPPGGDFSEPVTRHTQRFSRCFWALDQELANQRHYPAVDWEKSYSLYLEQLTDWWQGAVDADWRSLRSQALEVLRREAELQQIVQLVGPEALAVQQRWVLAMAKLVREGLLQQDAHDDIDAYCEPEKQIALLELFVWLSDRGTELLDIGVPFERLRAEVDLSGLIRLKEAMPNDEISQIRDHRQTIKNALERLRDENE